MSGDVYKCHIWEGQCVNFIVVQAKQSNTNSKRLCFSWISSTVLSEGAYRKDRHHWNTGGHLFNIANCSSTLMDSSCIMKPLDSKWWLWVNLERLVFWQGLASRCDYLAFRWIIFTITWTAGGENFGLCLYAKGSSHTHGLLISHCWDAFIVFHQNI